LNVVAADANPMRRDFWNGAPGGGAKDRVTDRRLADTARFFSCDEYIAAWNAGAWKLNSPNHDFKGQNVLYLDGHVAWKTHPYVGPNWDNIWLRRRTNVSVEIDPMNIETLRAYNDETSYDGKSILPADSKDDSFLVP
jgi:prepilin-type processing-associated H-X9-DG protein